MQTVDAVTTQPGGAMRNLYRRMFYVGKEAEVGTTWPNLIESVYLNWRGIMTPIVTALAGVALGIRLHIPWSGKEVPAKLSHEFGSESYADEHMPLGPETGLLFSYPGAKSRSSPAAPKEVYPAEIVHKKLEDALATGFPFVFLINRKNYRAYPTEDAAVSGLALHVHKEVFEVISGDRPMRALIDCDARCDASDAELQVVTDAFRDAALNMGVPPESASPLILYNDRAEKRSRHLIAKWGVLNWRHLKRFEDEVRGRVGVEGVHGGRTVIDGLSKKLFCFRIPGVPKLDGNFKVIDGSILRPEEGEWDEEPRSISKQTIDAWIVQGVKPLKLY